MELAEISEHMSAQQLLPCSQPSVLMQRLPFIKCAEIRSCYLAAAADIQR
jgi:hypothetical protein